MIVLDHLTEAQRRALVIADNQLALRGTGWDEELLRGLLAELRQDDFNLDVLGFSDEELNVLLAEAPDLPEGLTDETPFPSRSRSRSRGAATCGFWASIGCSAATPRTEKTWTAWWPAKRWIWSTPILLTTCASSRARITPLPPGCLRSSRLSRVRAGRHTV